MTARWLVTGASGLLGHSLCRYLAANGNQVIGVSHSHTVDVEDVETLFLDLTDTDSIAPIVHKHRPDVIVHAAGLTNVDACEADEGLAMKIHSDAAGALARASVSVGAKMVYISTDHLWDGYKPMVDEEEQPKPMNAYARTKLEGERVVLEINKESLVVRTNFFGPGRPWRLSLSDWIIGELSEGRKIKAFSDVYFTPLCLSSLCPALVDLVEAGAYGVYNLAGGERVSKYDFAKRIAGVMNLPHDLIEKGLIKEAGLKAPRPNDMSLATEKISEFLGRPMPTLDQCFQDFVPK